MSNILLSDLLNRGESWIGNPFEIHQKVDKNPYHFVKK